MDLQCEDILSGTYLLLCRKDHPLAHQEWVSWQDRKQAALVLQDYASGRRPLIDAALAHFAIEADMVQEIGQPATLFPMGEAGIGISVRPARGGALPQGSHVQGWRVYTA
ncbi:lysR substrate binding domain protein [Salmonella enterica]|nr:lysR substrate binding domain protein [Salmonella enterica]